MSIYLYVKTHNITNLKYLGHTTKKDPHSYLGSGIYWRRHLKKYGSVYTTEILQECSNNEEVKIWGLYYSHLWNVVESDEWANLVEEQGVGTVMSESTRKRRSHELTGLSWEERYGNDKAALAKKKLSERVILDKTKEKMSLAHAGKFTGCNHSRFKGFFYVTPWGEFPSAGDAALNFPCGYIDEGTIRSWCIHNNCKPLTQHTISRSKFFSADQKGKTFNQLGFGYEQREYF